MFLPHVAVSPVLDAPARVARSRLDASAIFGYSEEWGWEPTRFGREIVGCPVRTGGRLASNLAMRGKL